MKWNGCLRFTLNAGGDAEVSWVALMRDLRLSAGIVTADWRDECSDVYCLRSCRRSACWQAEDWSRENKSDECHHSQGGGGWRQEVTRASVAPGFKYQVPCDIQLLHKLNYSLYIYYAIIL